MGSWSFAFLVCGKHPAAAARLLLAPLLASRGMVFSRKADCDVSSSRAVLLYKEVPGLGPSRLYWW